MDNTSRPAKPPEYAWLNPTLVLADHANALKFYEEALGFKLEERMDGPNGELLWAYLSYKDTRIFVSGEMPDANGDMQLSPKSLGIKSMPAGLYMYCDDVDAVHEKALAAGATCLEKPYDSFWGDRFCRIVDPEGYVWMFARNIGEFDPTKIPS